MNTDKGLIGETALTEAVIGAAFEVSNVLGCGFLEKVYENALAIELRRGGHHLDQQRPIEVWYRGEMVGLYQADLVIDDDVVVELKVVRALDNVHRAQCMNYLRAANLERGLLINFGLPHIDVRRVQTFRT
jgi:GxxExxY protein